MAFITNYHKLSGIIKLRFFSLMVPEAKISFIGLMLRCHQVWFLLETPGEGPLSCLFWLLWATSTLWPMTHPFLASFQLLASVIASTIVKSSVSLF